MEQKRLSWTSAVKPALNGIIIVGMGMVNLDSIQAAEKKSYTKPPFTAFSSQMTDGLSGGGKYEKPVWNLHDTLQLPNWLELGIEQRTRYETMDGNFRGGSKGGDQPQTDTEHDQPEFGARCHHGITTSRDGGPIKPFWSTEQITRFVNMLDTNPFQDGTLLLFQANMPSFS